jgi:hypothetical protein
VRVRVPKTGDYFLRFILYDDHDTELHRACGSYLGIDIYDAGTKTKIPATSGTSRSGVTPPSFIAPAPTTSPSSQPASGRSPRTRPYDAPGRPRRSGRVSGHSATRR